jgi:hypothetical protein
MIQCKGIWPIVIFKEKAKIEDLKKYEVRKEQSVFMVSNPYSLRTVNEYGILEPSSNEYQHTLYMYQELRPTHSEVIKLYPRLK